MKIGLRAAWVAALLTSLVAVSSAGATPPGKNGVIVYDVYNPRIDAGDLYVVDAPGRPPRPLVATKADEYAASWSPDGKTLAFARILPGRGQAAIYLADAHGRHVRKLIGGDRWYINPSWSPDGKRIAFYSDRDFPRPGGNQQPPPPEIYTIGIDGKSLRRLTHNRAMDWDPIWAPDGKTLAFFSNRDARPGSSLNIYLIGADGSNARRVTRIGGRSEWNPSFAPDGQTLVYETAAHDGRQSDIWLIGRNGHHARPLITGPRWETNPVWSPDGNQIAFTSDRQAAGARDRENAYFELWVMDLQSKSLERLTHDRLPTLYPEWQPHPAA
ncbi:MAG: TolB protein [Gaiellales bacterium]|nr:TolB protein [Gaiellales bacterium]